MVRRTLDRIGPLITLVVAVTCLAGWRTEPAGAGDRDGRGPRPVAFEANQGQADGRVKFLARGAGYTAFLTAGEAVVVSRSGGTVRLGPVQANPAAEIAGDDRLPGVVNYGGRSSGPITAPTYARVRYREIYPGIDLVYYGRSRQLEYDFVVAPGADPDPIAMRFDGAERMEIAADGALVLTTATGELRQPRPVVYQTSDGARREVRADYRIDDDGNVRFRLGSYDPALALVIDPVLAYATYLGGSNDEHDWHFDPIVDVAVDAAGNAYVAGTTTSIDFPTTPGVDGTLGGSVDVFVTKFSPTGAVLYSTFVGGPCDDIARRIVVDGGGNAYVTGRGNDGFCFTGDHSGVLVAKLGPTGSLVYSLVFGATWGDTSRGEGIAVDAQGHAYVTGPTDSTSGDFPTTAGALRTERCPWDYAWAATDGFVAKINPTGTGFVYSTYLCGNGADRPHAITVDDAGHAYVAGSTNAFDFPTINALQETPRAPGIATGFLSKLSPDGSRLVFSTYFGGTDQEEILGVALDAQRNVYLTGQTLSIDFPTTAGALQETAGPRFLCSPCVDAFVTKIDATGQAIVYSTYLFGESGEAGYAITVDAAGSAYVAGQTDSAYFPILNAFQSKLAGVFDGFVAKLSPDGSRLVYSSYLGGSHAATGLGSGWDGATGIGVDAAGNAWVAGHTVADDFPTTPGAFQPTIGGGMCDFLGTPCRDAVVVKITAGGPGVIPPTNLRVTPSDVVPGSLVTATWAGLPWPSTSDEIRLFPLGGHAGPSDGLVSWPTGGTVNGVLTLALPAGLAFATYELRVLSPDPNTFDRMTVVARSEPIHVGPVGADLVVLAAGAPPATLAPGQTFAVGDTVKNEGGSTAAASTTRYYLSLDAMKDATDTLLAGGRAVPMLAPGEDSRGQATATVPLTMAPATYHLLACADDTQVVAETSEANNCLATGTTVVAVARPDLVETALTAPPAAARPGTWFAVTDTVKNQGAQAAGASTTRYYLSIDAQRDAGDRLLTGSHAVTTLTPGAVSTRTVTVTIPAATPTGTYRMLACADDTRTVTESDETNNCLAAAGTITVALPDLVQQSVSNPGGAVKRGRAFTVTDTVVNAAAVTTAKASTTRYYLSSDTAKARLTGSRTVPILVAGATSTRAVSVTVPTTTVPGTYAVIACADDLNAIVETEEDNNCRASATPIVVTP